MSNEFQKCLFFVSLLLFQYFKGHCAAEPLFRLKVRGERLKAGSFYRFALNYFMLSPEGRYQNRIKIEASKNALQSTCYISDFLLYTLFFKVFGDIFFEAFGGKSLRRLADFGT